MEEREVRGRAERQMSKIRCQRSEEKRSELRERVVSNKETEEV